MQNKIQKICGIAGALLLAAAVLMAVCAPGAAVRVVDADHGIRQCVTGFLGALNRGQLPEASALLYTEPDLTVASLGAVEQYMWEGYLAGIQITEKGKLYFEDDFVCQDIRMQVPELLPIVNQIRDAAAELAAAEYANGTAREEICDESGIYRESFAQRILAEIAEPVFSKPCGTTEQELTLRLLYADSRWQIYPTRELYTLLYAGMVQ